MLHLSAKHVQDLLSDGKLHMRDVLGNHLKDRSFRLVHCLSITYFCEKPVKNPSIWKESLTWIVLWIRFVRGRIWKGDISVADIEELETLDASEIYSKRLNAKKVIFTKESGNFIFPVADGRIKLSGVDQDLRTSTLIQERPIR